MDYSSFIEKELQERGYSIVPLTKQLFNSKSFAKQLYNTFQLHQELVDILIANMDDIKDDLPSSLSENQDVSITKNKVVFFVFHKNQPCAFLSGVINEQNELFIESTASSCSTKNVVYFLKMFVFSLLHRLHHVNTIKFQVSGEIGGSKDRLIQYHLDRGCTVYEDNGTCDFE